MEKRTYSCTERSWDRTRQVHRLVFSIDCHTPTLPDLVSSWTLLRRRRRLRSSISSCRRVSPSRSCDASQCGKGIPSSVLLFSVFPPGCPRLDEQWANLRFKDLWLIQLSVISCTIYTVCMATHCEILSYRHNQRLLPFQVVTALPVRNRQSSQNERKSSSRDQGVLVDTALVCSYSTTIVNSM